MIKHYLTVLIAFVFASCKSVSQNAQGVYSQNGMDYQYHLTLNDSSFTLTQKYFEVNSTCKGKWNYIAKDTILLKCNDEDLSAKLQSGYISERERKIVVLNKNKLQLGEIILKRKR
jgi:uncharacterized lipoprotein NlpE involved in copper resistance